MPADVRAEYTLHVEEELRLLLPAGESVMLVKPGDPPIVINLADPHSPITARRMEDDRVLLRNDSNETHQVAIPNLSGDACEVTVLWRGDFGLDPVVRPAGRGGFDVAP